MCHSRHAVSPSKATRAWAQTTSLVTRGRPVSSGRRGVRSHHQYTGVRLLLHGCYNSNIAVEGVPHARGTTRSGGAGSEIDLAAVAASASRQPDGEPSAESAQYLTSVRVSSTNTNSQTARFLPSMNGSLWLATNH